MTLMTGRFGLLDINAGDRIEMVQGILGFPNSKNFYLVDPGDNTFVLWLQSLEESDVAFPVLEPKIFKEDYSFHLSVAELRELNLKTVNDAVVLAILTIPAEISQMSANLKAPVVINSTDRIAKQVVLQESEYNIKYSMFKELKRHIVTSYARDQSVTPRSGKINAAPAAAAVSLKKVLGSPS